MDAGMTRSACAREHVASVGGCSAAHHCGHSHAPNTSVDCVVPSTIISSYMARQQRAHAPCPVITIASVLCAAVPQKTTDST